MTIVKRCDVCGEDAGPHSKNFGWLRFGAQEWEVTAICGFQSSGNTGGKIDLCPECNKAVLDLLKKRLKERSL